jgi:DNA-binding GntR family transcriptional regulator
MFGFMDRRGTIRVAASLVDTSAKERVRRRTIAHAVADGLARLIELRVYQPGDRLRERAIAEGLDVSRGPVGEAFRI